MSSTQADTRVGTRFLEALTSRDYDALGACFAADAALRGVVPPGVREADGREAIVERFRIWTEDIADYELAECDAAPFADLLRLRWAVRGVDPEIGLNATSRPRMRRSRAPRSCGCASPAPVAGRSEAPAVP